MSRAAAVIHAGVCGYVTHVTATPQPDDETAIRLDIASPCQNIQGLAGGLTVVDAYGEISLGFDGEVHAAARSALKGCRSGCVVPNGIFKAMQVAGGLALTADVRIELMKGEVEG